MLGINGRVCGEGLMIRTYPPTLQWHERLYHRDELRAGRYAALADSEGFHEICFALEALGLRLLGKKADLGRYQSKLRELAEESVVLRELSMMHAAWFSKFSSLYALVRSARNDAMHTGVYARHATAAAIELCIGLEEALMKEQQHPRQLVEDFMVKSPCVVESWQPVAYARKLMLTHSFSFLPVFLGNWRLISEISLARYMRSGGDWKTLISTPIEYAANNGLELIDASVVNLKDEIHSLLYNRGIFEASRLWLVKDEHVTCPVFPSHSFL